MANTIVYDSTTQSPNGANSGIEQGGFQAFSFTTGATPGSLSDVQVELFELSPDSGSITGYLYSNNAASNTPDTQLAALGTVSDSSLNSGPGNAGLTLADFSGAPATTLAPNTRYWIKLVSTANSMVGVESAAGDGGTGVATEFQQGSGSPAGTSNSNAASGSSVQAKVTEAVCFASGTLIRTSRGEVAVEALQVGDIAITASGAERPIRWIGCRTINCSARLGPSEAWPIRIRAGAFAANRPERTLYLSPGHPVLVGADADNKGGVLVPIMCLINGTMIARAPCDEVTYWHVELDTHDILLAEGLPAESYIDLGSRPWFAGAEGALYDPDFAAPGQPGRCRPVAIDGALVEAERRRLDFVFASRLAAQAAWPAMDAAVVA